MSISLDLGTKPKGLAAKSFDSFGSSETVIYLGDYEISLNDFLFLAKYVLINTDLRPNDSRLSFVERVKSMTEAEGYNRGGKRLVFTEPQ